MDFANQNRRTVRPVHFGKREADRGSGVSSHRPPRHLRRRLSPFRPCRSLRGSISAASSYQQQSRGRAPSAWLFRPATSQARSTCSSAGPGSTTSCRTSVPSAIRSLIPMGEARWSGDTYVSEKRGEPGRSRQRCARRKIRTFLPTLQAAIRGTAQPRCPASVQFLRKSLPHSRHGCALPVGRRSLRRPYPDVQSGRRGSLSARARRTRQCTW